MNSGFGVALTAIFLTAWLSYEATAARHDRLVKDLPSQANYQLCEQVGSKLESFDRVTCTCESGFQFDIIKEKVE